MATEAPDGGRPVETTAADVLAAFDDRDDPAEPLTSTEVADRAGCSRRTALNRLHDLKDAGDVASKKVGGRARVWWVPRPSVGEAAPSSAPQERVRTSAGAADQSDATGDGTRETAETAAEVTPAAVDRDQLRDALPGNGALLKARVDAILRMYAYLREHGTAEKGDLLELVDVDTVGYASPDSVWANMVKGRDTLRALPGVETPPTGRTEWRYTGENGDVSGIYDPSKESEL